MTLSLGGPLVDVRALAGAVDDPLVRVVDCRWYLGRPGDGRRAYDEGHIPGALHLDVDSDLTAPTGPGRHPLPHPVTFRRRLEEVGIGDEHVVVAYDDVGGWVAARSDRPGWRSDRSAAATVVSRCLRRFALTHPPYRVVPRHLSRSPSRRWRSPPRLSRFLSTSHGVFIPPGVDPS